MRAILFVTLFGIFPLSTALDATSWPDSDAPPFERLSRSAGLSDSTIYSLAQDSRGLLWLATGSEGVNVYDGHRFRNYRASDGPGSISHDDIGVILARRQGGIWAGTWGGGVERYDPDEDRFHALNPGRPPHRVQCLLEHRDGTLWVGSFSHGLFRLEPSSEELMPVPLPGSEAGHARIWSLAEDERGLWVGTSADLFYLPDDGSEIVSISLPSHPRALLFDDGILWIGSEDRLYRLDARRSPPDPELLATGLTDVNVLHRLPDRLLVGTLSGLQAVDPATGRRAPPLPGRDQLLISDSDIRDIERDRTGVLWLATREAGLLKMRSEPPLFDGALLPRSAQTVIAIAELAPGDFLLGMRRGLWRAERREGRFLTRPLPATAELFISAILPGPDGALWVGAREGLFVFDPVSDTIAPAPLLADQLGKIDVNFLYRGPRGRFWIGLWGLGILWYDPVTKASGLLDRGSRPSLPQNEVTSFAIDDAGILWVGGWTEGLARLDLETGLTERFASDTAALPPDMINTLHADPHGSLWIGTSFGLFRMDTASREISPVPLTRDSEAVPISDIVPDAAGNLWLSTSQGLARLDAANADVVWFNEGDGLPLTELFLRASATGESGRLYFGGVGGFISFDPAKIDAHRTPPEVSITGVLVDGAPASLRAGVVTLHPHQRELTVRYAAIDFRRPERNRFQYRLENLDRDWRAVTDQQEATYMNLEPGHFRFQVRAANSNGVWNDVGTELTVVVEPPWWGTVWGRALTWCVALLAIFGWHQWRTYRIRALNRQLEARVIDKTDALRQANEELARAAHTDFLTGLPNRRGFMASLDGMSSLEANRDCVAVADVDDFKRINDRHGHEIGDHVLKQLAKLVAGLVRQGDLVARWGGEELVFLLRGVDLEQGREAVDRIRRAVEEQPIKTVKGTINVTITVGVAAHRDGETVDEWLDRADRALYSGKGAGKNRVVGDGGN